jgi:hypothetical protein
MLLSELKSVLTRHVGSTLEAAGLEMLAATLGDAAGT